MSIGKKKIVVYIFGKMRYESELMFMILRVLICLVMCMVLILEVMFELIFFVRINEMMVGENFRMVFDCVMYFIV